MTEFCDYCGDELPIRFRMRAVGFIDGSPQVKTWCGACETPDDIDPEADRAFIRVVEQWRGRQS